MIPSTATLHRVGFLAIGRKRPGFDPQWGAQMQAAAWQVCDTAFDARRPTESAVDDGSLRAALDEFQRADCRTLIVLQPTMGDGRLAPILKQLWDGPIVLWATPERPDADRVTACSLVGTHVFASMLRQMQHPFEMVYGDPENDETSRQLKNAVNMACTLSSLRRAKVGLIGYHAPGFINMHADPMTLQSQLGVQLMHLGLAEFQQSVSAIDQQRVADDVDQVLQMRWPMESGLGRDELVPNSRYYLAMLELLEQEHLDALALRCWPELPAALGHWPYLAMMRLAEAGRSVALEGDVDGAILGMIGSSLGLGPGYVSDWLEHDQQSITLWHPGHAPRSFCKADSIQLGRHFNNDLPLVVNSVLKSDQPVTLARLWRCDDRYHLTAFAARTTAPTRKLLGAHGRVEVEGTGVPDRFERLCHAGMPHHVTLFQGHAVDRLRRFAERLGLFWIST